MNKPMFRYIGTKIVNAAPLTRGEYNALRGWETPADENPADAGYLVEYVDGGKPNHPKFEGYISWSPADVFAKAYRPNPGMTFSQALEALKACGRVARAGWNGKGMFLFLVPGSRITVSEGRPLAAVFPVGAEVDYLPHIDMKTADGKVVPWLASQTDVLAEDWTVVSPEAGG